MDKSFWEHLEDLRSVMFRALGVFLFVAVVLFVFMPTIFDRVILAPTRPDFPVYALFEKISQAAPILTGSGGTPGADTGAIPDSPISLINIELASQFMIHMSATCWLTIVLIFPLVIWLLWGFVKPGLYPEERKHSHEAFILGNLMFYLGVAVGYFLVFPLALRFLAGYQLSPAIPNQISLTSYMDTFITLLLMMGLVFELPLLAWVLGKMGLITRQFFTRYRRHAIVALLILAAIITPTGDPLTLFVVFIPVYILWELSAYLVKPAAQTPEI